MVNRIRACRCVVHAYLYVLCDEFVGIFNCWCAFRSHWSNPRDMAMVHLEQGQLYLPKAEQGARHKYRRIVGIVNGMVFYCVGKDRLFNCSAKSFLRWGKLKEKKSVRANTVDV